MLISISEFVQGGISKPRNEIIMKLFRLLGESERQGFGGPQIFRSAFNSRFRIPEIHTNLESTELKLWYIDLIDSYPELTIEEKKVFECIIKAPGPISKRNIEELLNFSAYQSRKSLESLLEAEKIEMVGKGSATRYLPKMGSNEMITQLQMIIN
jgi:predicted HTH transcriptional regulator